MKKFRLRTLLIVLAALFVLACEADDAAQSSHRPQDTDPADSDTNSETTQVEESDDPTDTGRENLDPVPLCVKACSAPADCVEEGADKLHRASNYTCDGGLCNYIGCTSDANCDGEYPAEHYVCASNGECLYPCENIDDCVLPGMDADADNWECTGGGCKPLGCNNSYECVMTYGDNYVCTDILHKGISSCSTACEKAADCVTNIDTDNEAFNADNYQCIEKSGEIRKWCDYKGCANDAECGDGYRCVLED